ncbi:MAG: T9SS type A sorting domain-containing protein [Calditrichaeota bacterium]|nr:T9SS type A sorting domain-containing protein [Calditrichota bacterium]
MKKISLFVLTASVIIFLFIPLRAKAQQDKGSSLFKKIREKQSVSKTFIPMGKKRLSENVKQRIFNKMAEQRMAIRRMQPAEKHYSKIKKNFNPNQKALGSGVISGFVFEQDGVTPIQHQVTIEVFDDAVSYAGIDFVDDYDNYYEITDLETGDYYVWAVSGNYIDEFYDNAANFSDASLVHVQNGQVTANINFSLQPNTVGVGAISGNVTAPNGLPESNCIIEIYGENQNYQGSESVNANGDYLLSSLAAGNYKLLLRYYGDQNYASEWYENASNFSDATFISVTEGDTIKHVDFVLDWGGCIAGKIVRPDGSPLEQYDYVNLTVYDLDYNWVNSFPVDESGNFNISQLQTGSYKLQFEYDGMNNFFGGWYLEANNFESATPINVTAGDTVKNIIFTLREAGAISGRVTGPNGAPIEWEVEITAYDQTNEEVGFSQSEENGFYSISSLPSGKYKLFAEYTSMYAANIIQTPASEWFDGVYDETLAAWVDVTAGDTTKNIDFTLEAGGVIKGNVYSPENALLDYSGTVTAYDSTGKLIRQGINANLGMYMVAGLPTGSYKLYFIYNGEQNYLNEWYDGKSNFLAGDDVNVIAGHWTSGIDFTLDYVSGFKGMIKDASGNALTGETHYVLVYLIDPQTEEFAEGDVANELGGYNFKLHGVSYKIAACSGYGNWMSEDDSLSLTFYGQGHSLNDPNTETVAIIPDSIIGLDDITMQKATGSISGKVFVPITDELMTEGIYYIFAFDEDGCLAKFSAFEDESGPINGSYAVKGLRPGNYYLLALAQSQNFGVTIWATAQWYGDIFWNGSIEFLSPKMEIPQGAVPITVGTGDTPNIDFHLSMPTDVPSKSQPQVAKQYRLRQNYPNPFNPETTIQYEIPKATHVELSIYNLLGQMIQTLVDKKQSAGSYKLRWNASNLPSGIYFYHLKTKDFVKTRKCLFLK